MAEINFVVPSLVLREEAVFDMKEVYKMMRSWYELHGYNFMEKEYEDVSKAEAKDIKIKWVAEKKVDDYTKFVIEQKITVKNHKNIQLEKNGKLIALVKGSLQIIFIAYLQGNYEGKWAVNPFRRFVRGVYDKFFLTDRIKHYQNELKEETYSIFNEVKSYLALYKFA